ncbi:MAG: hypothetical protein EXR72_08945 [Myxococcales bacterium]|nr:hypothetical protein [Myxococcales bacterium]
MLAALALCGCDTGRCDDGLKNGNELDVDCGGSCSLCGQRSTCDVDADCASGTCTTEHRCGASRRSGICKAGGCEGAPCRLDYDCQEALVCSYGLCRPSSCRDGSRSSTETDVDCGGPRCPACGEARFCSYDSDCAPGLACAPKIGVCVPCRDCGGSCGLCMNGSTCGSDADCSSYACSGGRCERERGLLPTFGKVVTQAVPPPPLSGGTLIVLHDGHTAVASDPERDTISVVDLLEGPAAGDGEARSR